MIQVWADTGLTRRSSRGVEVPAERMAHRGRERSRRSSSPPRAKTIDTCVIVADGNRQILKTRYVSGCPRGPVAGLRVEPDAGVEQPRAFRDGQPLFFELWDSDYLADTFLGGFVVYPKGVRPSPVLEGERLADYTARILWDWKGPQTISRPGHATGLGPVHEAAGRCRATMSRRRWLDECGDDVIMFGSICRVACLIAGCADGGSGVARI